MSSTAEKLPGARPFATTQWSMVLAAGRSSSPEAKSALGALCEAYWYPLYGFIFRQTADRLQAQDLTQEFFAKLLDKNYLRGVDPKKGKFRSFLLTACKHFLANERDRDRAEKRGGDRTRPGAPGSLDFADAESRYTSHRSTELTPEKLFDRLWALTLLDRVLSLLRAEFSAANKLPLFDHLKNHLTQPKESAGYRETAEQLGMSEGAVKVAVHRLRKRYRELLRQEIATTTASADDVEGEIRDLFSALGT